jgi:hypothetical protein
MADSVSPDAGTPRWVKVAVIVAILIVVLVVVGLVVAGHEGPSRHSA